MIRNSVFDRSEATAGTSNGSQAHRGLEISSAAADGDRSVVLDQVRAGVSVRMAVLYHLVGGQAVGHSSAAGHLAAAGLDAGRGA